MIVKIEPWVIDASIWEKTNNLRPAGLMKLCAFKQELLLAHYRPSLYHPVTSSVLRSQTNIVEYTVLIDKTAADEHRALTLFNVGEHL